MTPYNQFLSNLIRIRTDKKLTSREFAARCHINYSAYRKIEQGIYDDTIGVFTALSDGLGVSFLELMGIDTNQIPRFSYYENRLVTEDMEEVRTYGIAVCSKTNMVQAENGTFTFHYSDLTTKKDELANLVDLMNREQLSLAHVEDVIEDFLAEIR